MKSGVNFQAMLKGNSPKQICVKRDLPVLIYGSKYSFITPIFMKLTVTK